MKRLFLDIETCPCIGSFWRPGYNISLSHENIEVQARIITAAYRWQGDKKVQALIWDEVDSKTKEPFGAFQQSDERLVKTLVPIMNKADEIVAHYGDGFDVPWIRTRAMFHGIVGGIWKTVDTKAWASKNFVLPSNKLDAIAKYLGIGTKIRPIMTYGVTSLSATTPRHSTRWCDITSMTSSCSKRCLHTSAGIVSPILTLVFWKVNPSGLALDAVVDLLGAPTPV